MWNREKNKITDEEPNEFFNIVSKKSYNDPASQTYFNAEGEINFKSVLYLPSELPQCFMNEEEDTKNDMKLHVKKVLVSDSFELLPLHINFVMDAVDSDYLPLNINRKTLQERKVIRI